MEIGKNNINQQTFPTNLNNYTTSNESKLKENSVFSDISEKDSFEEKDKSQNGKFDFSEAAKNFLKGAVSPIKAAIEHPVMTAGVVAATVGACLVAPVLAPVLTVGFLCVGAYQIGKGCYDAAKNISEGKYDEAEKSFEEIGEGTVGTALSIAGVKQGAIVAKEAKVMSELNAKSLNKTQTEAIAEEIGKNSKIGNIKEMSSLVTTKTGRNALVSQLKPSSIQQRISNTINRLKAVKNFKETPEGKRRAALSDEEIQSEVQASFDKAFDELNIPKEKRPKLEIVKDNEQAGGFYDNQNHKIKYNPEAYKAGVFEIDDVIMHEATHCNEALKRAGIPKERAEQIVEEELISRIKNGESEEIVVKGGLLGPETMKPPKMSEKMKNDFIDFAQENLYKDKFITNLSPTDNQNVQMIEKLRTMIKNNPEFVEQYGSEEKALSELSKYSVSHNLRYNNFKNTNAGEISKLQVEELSGEELAKAEQSLKDYIETIEGNSRIQGVFKSQFADRQDFNQYQFSPEEVLAQRNGNNAVIKNVTEKLNSMRTKGTLTAEDETFMNMQIDKAKAIVNYKTKGLEYYKKYTELINNPENKELEKEVQLLEKEIQKLEIEILKSTVKSANKTYTPTNAIYELISELEEIEK